MSSKYRELISKTDEEKAAAYLELDVKKAKLTVEGSKVNTAQALAGAEAGLARAKATNPLDLNAILEAMEEVTSLKIGLENLAALEKELFEEE